MTLLTELSTGLLAYTRSNDDAYSNPQKRAKRPGVAPPMTASDPHPQFERRGTLNESNGRYLAAVEHLAMLKTRRERAQRDEIYYVQLGDKYGVSEADIVTASGLVLDRVRHILAGGS